MKPHDISHVITTAVLDHAGEWQPFSTLETRALGAVQQLRAQCDSSERFWVISGRMHSRVVSWARLAGPLGISKQALQKKYQPAVDQALSDEVKGFRWWWRYDNGCCAACNRPMANANVTDPAGQQHRKRQHRLTTGDLVEVCGRCAKDPARLHTIETDQLV